MPPEQQETPAADGAAVEASAAPSSVKEALLTTAAPEVIAAAEDPAKPESVKGRLEAEAKGETPAWAAGVPEHMLGETPEETLAKVNAAYIGARKSLAAGKTAAADVPDKPDGYEFTLPDDYTKEFGDGKDDPLLKKFADRAHAGGVGKAQAQELVNGFISDAMESGFYEPPLTMAKFYEDLGGEEAGGKMVADVGGFIKTLAASGKLGDQSTPDGKAAVESMVEAGYNLAAESPAGLKFLDAVRQAQNGPSMTLPRAGDSNTPNTLEALREAMKDPRYNQGSGSFSPAYRKQIDAGFDALDRAG